MGAVCRMLVLEVAIQQPSLPSSCSATVTTLLIQALIISDVNHGSLGEEVGEMDTSNALDRVVCGEERSLTNTCGEGGESGTSHWCGVRRSRPGWCTRVGVHETLHWCG